MKYTFLVLFSLLLTLPTGSTWAEEIKEDSELRPLWEIGLFNGYATIPHYRGSDQSDQYGIVVPYFVYRGKVLESDRDGMRGILYQHKNVKTSISVSFKPPVDEDNDAREGMSDLEPLFEIGPAVEVGLWEKGPQRLFLKTELRGVSEIDSSEIQHIGWRARGRIIWRHGDVLGNERLRIGGSTGFEWGSSEYHTYLYGVSGDDVTPSRAAYSASSGYAGAAVSVNAFYRLTDRFSIGGFARYTHLSGTEYEDSPLIKQDYAVISGIALVVKLKKSKRPEWRTKGLSILE